MAKAYTAPYMLNLTHAEGQFLADLMQFIGGCPDGSRRRHADAIREALLEAGADDRDVICDVGNMRAVYFLDGDEMGRRGDD